MILLAIHCNKLNSQCIDYAKPAIFNHNEFKLNTFIETTVGYHLKV